eukprot:scaffold86157_cov51-Phaeocystis_antarctica.AAC.2
MHTISATSVREQRANIDTSSGTLSTPSRCGRTAAMPRGSLTTPGAGERGTESPPPPVSPRQMHEFQSVSRPSW